MFMGCSNLEFIDLSSFDTSNVNNMAAMFNNCNKLKEIKGINKFNTNKVTHMSAMFQECNVLVTLEISKLVKSKYSNSLHS